VGCTGIASLKGKHVVPTGWIHIDDMHVPRAELARLLATVARPSRPSSAALLTCSFWATYLPHQIQPDRTGGTDALDRIYRSRRARGMNLRVTCTWPFKKTLLIYSMVVACRAAGPR
jgi:hypothetical protein